MSKNEERVIQWLKILIGITILTFLYFKLK